MSSVLNLSEPDLLREACLIDGTWRGKGSDEITNPATGDIIARVPHFDEAETVQAVAAAKRAFGPWSRLTAKERSRIMRRWFDLIIDNQDDLARILTAEQGKPLAEARGEIVYAAAYIEFFAEQAKRVQGELIASPREDARISVLRQPIGVVAAITPWNFPAAMITRKVAPALAVGCTVVVKPAPETPLTAFALGVLAHKAGIPAGVINIITGDAAKIGSVLTSHPAVRCVSFTGSTEVGKILMRQCAGTVKRVALELGGNAPFIVCEDADLDAAIEGAIQSKYRNMGQTCVCANRFYVHESLYEPFIAKLTRAVSRFKVGNGMDEGVDQGPLITMDAIEKVEEHIADALDKGATVVIGGHRHERGGTFFEPTILANVTADMRVTREETFGPVAPVLSFRHEAEAIEAANATPFGLAAYVYARDIGRITRMTEALEYGMIGVNTGLISSEMAPFGGVKESGQGREGSQHGVDEFLEMKYVMIAGV